MAGLALGQFFSTGTRAITLGNFQTKNFYCTTNNLDDLKNQIGRKVAINQLTFLTQN